MTGSVFFGARLAACKKSAVERGQNSLAEMGRIARRRTHRSRSDIQIKACMWTEWGQNEDNSAPITRSQTPILQTITSAVFAILQELQVGP